MPLMRVSSLQQFCLKNIAFNIVNHGQKLTSRQDEEFLVYYEILKRDFGSDLMKELYRIHHAGEDNNNEQLNQLLSFVFCKAESDISSTGRLGLKLLFNEYTSELHFSAFQHPVIAHLLDFALPRCKNLKSVVLDFYNFVPEKWVSPQLRRHTVVKIDILYSSVNNGIVIDLLWQCPNLEIFKASGKTISSLSLYGLCSIPHIAGNIFQCDGQCADTGKRIRCLVLYGFNGFGQDAIACALMHLPSLEVFSDTYHGALSENSNIPYGINLLRKEALRTTQVPVSLNLTKLSFSAWLDMTTILNALKSCSRIKALCYGVDISTLNYFTLQSYETLKSIYVHRNIESKLMSHQFQDFLTVKGWQLETVSLNNRATYNESLDVKYIYNIIRHCINLKNLFVARVTARSDQSENLLFNVQDSHNVLQKISLLYTSYNDEAAMEFFVNLFSVSRKLKHVGLSDTKAINILTSAMYTGCFPCLERLVIKFADLESYSVLPLIHRDSRLRNITLVDCMNTKAFISEHQKAAQNCGFELRIDNFESSTLEGLDHHCF